MPKFDPRNSEIYLCKKCERQIPPDTDYYSIVRNLELFTFDPSTNEEEIGIIESEEVIRLCKTCGSYFNMEGLEKILEALPIPGHENKN